VKNRCRIVNEHSHYRWTRRDRVRHLGEDSLALSSNLSPQFGPAN